MVYDPWRELSFLSYQLAWAPLGVVVLPLSINIRHVKLFKILSTLYLNPPTSIDHICVTL